MHLVEKNLECWIKGENETSVQRQIRPRYFYFKGATGTLGWRFGGRMEMGLAAFVMGFFAFSKLSAPMPMTVEDRMATANR